MRLVLCVFAALLPVLHAREQQTFSLQRPQDQTIVPHHRQPWSLLLSKDPSTGDCIVLSQPEQAQIHRSINDPGDVLVINKTLSSVDGFEIIDQYVMEILGYDQRILWMKTSNLCSAIEYEYLSTDEDASGEYEVVCFVKSLLTQTKLHYSGNPANRIDFVMMCVRVNH
jgi:hypothetical protein